MKRVYLEITNACNLNCSFCTIDKGNRFLSLRDIDNYTDQIKQYCDYIYLHVLGEPLLHPNFNEILDLLDKKELKLQLVTNGTLLDKYPDLLKHKCLRKLSISIHSINNLPITNNYFKTIDELIENDNINIELRFYDLKNLDDNLINYLNKLKDKYNFKLTGKKNNYRLKNNLYIFFDELFKWPELKNDYISNTGKCYGYIDQLAILSDGTVTSCCLDPKGINKIGNLNEKSLKEILESNNYQNIVSNLKKQCFISPLCLHCSYHLRFEHNNN